MDDEKEPKIWVTVVKLAIGAIVFICFVGLGLYYTAKFNTYAPEEVPSTATWGISKDSPIRSNR